MKEHKSEIADWELGAGIYIDFYTLRNVFQDNQLMEKLDSLEKKNVACKDFYVHLNQSLCLWRTIEPSPANMKKPDKFQVSSKNKGSKSLSNYS